MITRKPRCGDRIAFTEHPHVSDNRGDVAVIDLQGRKTTLSKDWTDLGSLAWSKEWLEETAALTNDQTVEVAILSPSLQIGNTLALSGTTTMEPWAGVALDWTFLNKSKDAVFGTIVDDPSTDLRLQAGLNFGFGNNMQLALTGEASGLLLDETDTYTGEVNLAVQF